MVKIIASLAGILAIVLVTEMLYKKKLLQVEDRRKFVHILSGAFIAFWPNWMSWYAIEIIGLLIVLGVAVNRKYDIFKFSKHIHRETYGEYFFGLAVTLCALLTHDKVFFAIAMLILALSDGFAALMGKHYGKTSQYKVFGNTKTLAGTLAFWFVTLCILATGLLFAHDSVSLENYYWLVLFMPPILSLVESVFVWGLDDLAVPVLTVLLLNLAQS